MEEKTTLAIVMLQTPCQLPRFSKFFLVRNSIRHGSHNLNGEFEQKTRSARLYRENALKLTRFLPSISRLICETALKLSDRRELAGYGDTPS